MDNKSDTPIDVPPKEQPILERQITNKVNTPTPNNTPKKRKTNRWVQHVKNIAQQKGITYKQAMSIAKNTYNQ